MISINISGKKKKLTVIINEKTKKPHDKLFLPCPSSRPHII